MREELHTVAREKSCAVLNFARFDSFVCIVARSREKSRSLSLVQFLARYRSLSLSLTGLTGGSQRYRREGGSATQLSSTRSEFEKQFKRAIYGLLTNDL